MQFSSFASQVLFPLEQTAGKLEQTRVLAEFLRQENSQELPPALYLLLGQVGPIYDNPQFNMGLEFLLYALADLEGAQNGHSGGQDLFGNDVSGEERQEHKKFLKKRYKQLGDIGLLAEEVRKLLEVAPANWSTAEVHSALIELTQISGSGSQEEKIRFVTNLLRKVDPLSARYIARIVLGQLRLGVSEKTLLDAVSWALTGDKTQRAQLDEVYQRHPDVGRIGQLALAEGMEAVAKLDAELGVPIIPALCDRLKSAEEMIAKMGEVVVEPKYDGTRIQIHWDAKTKKLSTFTRNLEENAAMFPELPRLLAELPVDSIILDAEGVGYDPATRQLVPFQQTIKRKRKHGIEEVLESIPLRFFVFDVLSLNGKSYLRHPLQQRKEKLVELFSGVKSDLELAPWIETKTPEELRDFHAEQLALGLEGVVIKQIQGVYQSGRKAFNWVKFKEKEGSSAKLTDTIDAVILGYYYGRGKRTQFGIGAFLVGVLDEESEKIVTIAKIGTGLSDEQWRETKQRCEEVLQKGPKEQTSYQPLLPESLTPDVLVPASIVVEVAADEITKSPTHTAGVALRFPRLIRFRDDKNVEQATTTKELAQIKVA